MSNSWIGTSLSKRYLIEEMLGQGGMSAVYKGTDPNLKRVVAIKMIHSHLSGDRDFILRFEEEAAAVAQLRHPAIIQVYDFNQDDGVYYMVLEFVPGETIQEHLRKLNAEGQKLSIAKAIEYMADICDAVDYAHQRGLIHRDIKPANLMINTSDRAILMDFGIAKIVGGQRHTATGAVVGTAMYMSPEQIKGERPDRRTDIYSLGVTLFEMVGGRPPFQSDSAMTLMMMHINDPVPDPRKLNPEVPADLVAVINKALEKDPADRYQTAAQMAAALRNVLARIQSGASAQTAAPGMTMLESSPMSTPGPNATFLESAPHTPAGKVVESAPLPGMKTDSGTAAGATSAEMPAASPEATAFEPAPASPMGTVVESAPHSSMATGSRTGAGARSAELPAASPEATAFELVGGTTGSNAPKGAPMSNVSAGSGTVIESSTVRPMPSPKAPGAASAPKKSGLSMPVIAGIFVGLACLIFGGLFLINRLLSGGGGSATEEPVALVVAATEAPTETVAAVESTATPEETSTPSVTPTITNTPTATVPPGIPFARINSITINDQDRFVVEYETFEFTEVLPGMHLHFFFNTVSQENAGSPGSGPWILYGGPRPFTGYRVSDRPSAATQMCILVANSNHSVQPDSGNCVDLP